MSLSSPTRVVKSIVDTTATGTGTASYPFQLPADTTGVVVRVWTGATITTITADIYFQTSEDGGTTWRDCAHFPQVSSAIAYQNALFQPISVVPIVFPTCLAGAVSGFVSSVAASTLAAGTASGLPILGRENRIFISWGGGAGTNSGINIDVLANGQDAAV